MEIMTLKKAAEYLGMNAEVLRRKAANGTIPAMRLGSGKMAPWRFYREELDQYINWERVEVKEDQDQQNHVLEELRKFYKTEDEEVQINILRRIAEIKDTFAVPYLCEVLLNSENKSALIFWSIRALTEILKEDAAPYLVHFREHADPWIRIEIARYFALHFKDEGSFSYLEKYYRETHSFVVLQALLEIAPEKYYGELDVLITDSVNSQTRMLALRELRKLKHPNQKELLEPLLHDGEIRIKTLAVEIVGEKRIRELIPDLQEIIESGAPQSLKRQAALALSCIFS
ncbi:MAG: excisionase family DNA-binding protein [Candidatus Cloacimonetes bacterium]|nr:excisionase family DNA-binding protein [Candidatus Cloacimonadota bacterium]